MYRWKKFREVFVFKGLYDFIKSVTVIDLFLLFNSYRNHFDYCPTLPDNDLPETYQSLLRRGIQHENLSHKPLTFSYNKVCCYAN